MKQGSLSRPLQRAGLALAAQAVHVSCRWRLPPRSPHEAPRPDQASRRGTGSAGPLVGPPSGGSERKRARGLHFSEHGHASGVFVFPAHTG